LFGPERVGDKYESMSRQQRIEKAKDDRENHPSGERDVEIPGRSAGNGERRGASQQ